MTAGTAGGLGLGLDPPLLITATRSLRSTWRDKESFRGKYTKPTVVRCRSWTTTTTTMLSVSSLCLLAKRRRQRRQINGPDKSQFRLRINAPLNKLQRAYIHISRLSFNGRRMQNVPSLKINTRPRLYCIRDMYTIMEVHLLQQLQCTGDRFSRRP